MLLPITVLVVRIPGPPFLITLSAHQAILGIVMVFPVVVFGPPALLASRIGADALVGMKDRGEKVVAAERAAAGLSSHWAAPGMESKL
jgi:hypothetical protein